MSPNISARADQTKNRLYVDLEGFFDLQSAKNAVDEVAGEVRKLRPGFTVINDITKVKASSDEIASEIEDLLRLIERAGVSRVYRVVARGATVAKLQHKRLQRESGVAYEVIEVGSVEEAERHLDSL